MRELENIKHNKKQFDMEQGSKKTIAGTSPETKAPTKKNAPRLTRLDYGETQRARQMVKLKKKYTRQYTDKDGIENLEITYELNGVDRIAKTMDEWGHVLAVELSKKIMAWTPNDTVVNLTQLIQAMHFCDPDVKVDAGKIPTAEFDDRLRGFVVVADKSGWGLDSKGQLVELQEAVNMHEQAERHGMRLQPVLR